MIIAISGASGFVGKYLLDYFNERSYTTLALTRKQLQEPETLRAICNDADLVINLSGATILKRWSKKYKELLLSSRIDTTRALVKAINSAQKKPLFISTSAIGIYKDDVLYHEYSRNFPDTFLSQLCQRWEHEALKAETRTAIFRFSVILGQGGALQKMLLPFKLGLGGRIGSGKQAFSYIHIHDLARAYEHILKNDELEGLFNLCTPYPCDNKTLTVTLAKKLRRPALLPLPSWLVKLIFGEGATTLTQGQTVYPKRILESAFSFHYETLESILDDLLPSAKKTF